MPDQSARYAEWGFEPCEFEPDECDRCHRVAPLFFGDTDYWDCREGYYYCSQCLDQRIEYDLADLERIRVEMQNPENWPAFDAQTLIELDREEAWSEEDADETDESDCK